MARRILVRIGFLGWLVLTFADFGALAATELSRNWQYDGKTCQGREIVIDDQKVVIVTPNGQTQEFGRKMLSSSAYCMVHPSLLARTRDREKQKT